MILNPPSPTLIFRLDSGIALSLPVTTQGLFSTGIVHKNCLPKKPFVILRTGISRNFLFGQFGQSPVLRLNQKLPNN